MATFNGNVENIENNLNKVKDITEECTDEQYPSAKAAYKLLLLAHPVGSLYWSADATEPSLLFGGSWERVKDKFILAAGDSYEAGSTGGEAEHKLKANEIPRHFHDMVIANRTNETATAEYPAYALQFYEDSFTRSSSIIYGGVVGGGTSKVGGDGTHNNMPPYEVYYCWKRTA